MQPVLAIARSKHVPFDQLIELTMPVGTVSGSDGSTGMGDIEVFDLVAVTLEAVETSGLWTQ